MKFTKLNLALLATVLSCSSQHETQVFAKRQIANFSVSLDDEKAVENKVEKLIEGIFHSYLLGQVYLQDFDRKLDNSEKDILNSDAYAKLLVIRQNVDSYEEEVNQTYLDLVMITGSAQYTDAQKANAQKALDILGKFVEGVPAGKVSVPEALKPMVLLNLMHKQTALYEELDSIRQNPEFKNDKNMQEAIKKNMVLLRASRMAENKDMKTYNVDPEAVKQAVAEESKKPAFKNYEKNIKAQSKELKKYMQELKGGRSTSADIIFASAGASGNITGRGFPANTWSLTYDDGPGGKTSPTVLKNLVDRGQKATFFQLAKQVEALPNTAKSIKDAGMDMALHSYTHAQLTKVGPIQLEREIGGAKKVIEAKLGVELKLFRLPYGAGVSVANVRSKIAEHKLIHVFWNVDTLDWQDKNPQSIYNRAQKQMAGAGNKGIILFHDIHPQSVIASTMIMDYFKANAAKTSMCTVQQVVDQLNQQKATCK